MIRGLAGPLLAALALRSVAALLPSSGQCFRQIDQNEGDAEQSADRAAPRACGGEGPG
jgi:hypothetical protein